MFKKLKENKILNTIGDILYVVLFFLVLLMLVVVILQRVTDNSIAFGGIRMFTVATGSMVPKYEVGDILISKEIAPEQIKVGDDIVYRGKEGSFSGKIVTHQVISIEKSGNENYKIITKGIANNIEDPEIDQTQVYGKIIYKIQSLSFISKMIKNIYIFYFLIFVPIALLIFKQIKNIIDGDDEEDEDEKNPNSKKKDLKGKDENNDK